MQFDIHLIGKGAEDCFLLCFAGKDEKNTLNLLIDGGEDLYNSDALYDKLKGVPHIDGVVVTHMDSDHIGGIVTYYKQMLKLFETSESFLKYSMFLVFNELDQNIITISQAHELMELTDKLQKRLNRLHAHSEKGVYFFKFPSYYKSYLTINNLIRGQLRNDSLCLKFCSVEERVRMSNTFLDGDTIYITFLSPDKKESQPLMRKWKDASNAGLNTIGDGKLVNNSSISMLIEFGGKVVLMSGDTGFPRIRKKIILLKERIKKVDYIKLSHHGAEQSNARLNEVAEQTQCSKFFVSAPFSEKHPSRDLLLKLYNNDSTTIIYGAAAWPLSEGERPVYYKKSNKIHVINNIEVEE